MVTSGFACGNTLQDTLRGQCQDPNAPGQKFEIRAIMNTLELISWNIASDGKKITRKADPANLAGGVSEIAIVLGGADLQP